MNTPISQIAEHPMLPLVVEIMYIMGRAIHHPEDEQSQVSFGQMGKLAHATYADKFANKATREEFALFIGHLMQIYHSQFYTGRTEEPPN